MNSLLPAGYGLKSVPHYLAAWSDLPLYLLAAVLYGFPLFAVAFAAVRYGLSRLRPRQAHPKRWTLLSAGLATPLLCWGGLYAGLFLYSYYPHRNFNPDEWKFRPNQRYEMVAELQVSRRLIGLTQQQVAALLGPPSSQGPAAWEYSLGMPPGFSIDGDDLLLEFEDGKVIRTSVHQN